MPTVVQNAVYNKQHAAKRVTVSFSPQPSAAYAGNITATATDTQRSNNAVFGCVCDVQQYACAMSVQIVNIARDAANDAQLKKQQRERTVPIPNTIHHIPRYPLKLAVYKIAASKYWQVRCWHRGRTHRQSTKTQQLRTAISYAQRFYELLLVQHQRTIPTATAAAVVDDFVQPAMTFGAMAAQMFANEQARQARGEFTKGSLDVLRNRLDTHILPRWVKKSVSSVDYKELLAFAQFLSQSYSSITVSQYLVAVRKVLVHSVAVGAMTQLPQFPKIKVSTNSRGAFTPTEYVTLLRTARSMRGTAVPHTRTVRRSDQRIPNDVAWAIGFMVNAFIRPSDLKTLKHKHVELVRGTNTYLRLTLPATKKHDKPIVTLRPAVRIWTQMFKCRSAEHLQADSYLFLPHIQDRNYAGNLLAHYFNHLLKRTDLKFGANKQPRSLYSLRHSAITFRLLYGQGIDVLTLARNARTSVDVINTHYASTVTAEQNIGMLQSRRDRNARS